MTDDPYRGESIVLVQEERDLWRRRALRLEVVLQRARRRLRHRLIFGYSVAVLSVVGGAHLLGVEPAMCAVVCAAGALYGLAKEVALRWRRRLPACPAQNKLECTCDNSDHFVARVLHQLDHEEILHSAPIKGPHLRREVRSLQETINACCSGDVLPVDGIYDLKTHAAALAHLAHGPTCRFHGTPLREGHCDRRAAGATP